MNSKLTESIFRSLVQLYYPRNISATTDYEKYIQDPRFLGLKSQINSTVELVNRTNLREFLLKKFDNSKMLVGVEDVTNIEMDKCLTFKIEYIEETSLHQLYLTMSLIVPFYYTYVLCNRVKLNPYKWLELPKRDLIVENNIYCNQITILNQIVEMETNYFRFPDFLINKTIPEISYAGNDFGEFTFFNAFFVDDLKL